jgi:hypothetical protein
MPRQPTSCARDPVGSGRLVCPAIPAGLRNRGFLGQLIWHQCGFVCIPSAECKPIASAPPVRQLGYCFPEPGLRLPVLAGCRPSDSKARPSSRMESPSRNRSGLGPSPPDGSQNNFRRFGRCRCATAQPHPSTLRLFLPVRLQRRHARVSHWISFKRNMMPSRALNVQIKVGLEPAELPPVRQPKQLLYPRELT